MYNFNGEYMDLGKKLHNLYVNAASYHVVIYY